MHDHGSCHEPKSLQSDGFVDKIWSTFLNVTKDKLPKKFVRLKIVIILVDDAYCVVGT